jgi:hypothetical protein
MAQKDNQKLIIEFREANKNLCAALNRLSRACETSAFLINGNDDHELQTIKNLNNITEPDTEE